MNLANENPEKVLSILKTMRITSKGYYTLDELTIKRHSMVLDIMRIFEKQIQIETLDCHQKGYDPISYFLSSAYQNSESTSAKPFKPMWEIVKVLIDPKHEYFKYQDLNSGDISHAFWKPIETKQDFKCRTDKGKYIPYSEGRPLKMDTFFNTIADNNAKSYMGAVVAFNSEKSSKNHVIEVYYCSKYWTKLVPKKLSGGKLHLVPIENTERLPFGGGFTGNPKTQKVEYVLPKEPIMFGVKVESPLFQRLYHGNATSHDPTDFFNRRAIGFPHWTYESYTNVLITLLLMEHEMHHAMIGRYSPVMYNAPDLMEQRDCSYDAITELWKIYLHYYEGNTSQVRPERPINKQFGAEKIDDNVWWNAISNAQGHNAFFGHLTYRSGLFGLAVTTDPLKQSKIYIHQVLGMSISIPSEISDTKMLFDDGGTVVVGYTEDLIKLNLKF